MMTGTSHPGSGVEREPTRQPTRARADSGASHRARSTRRVVICGGGVASLETLLALRAHLKVGVEVHVVAPNRRFVYQPLAVAAPFDLAETHLLDLAEIVSDRGAQLHVDTLAGVDAENRRVRLAGDAELPYDVLVVAIGAQRRDWLEGALHFGGAASVGAFRALLERLENGSDRLVSFVNPAGVTWSLPLYELALLTASRVADRGIIGVGLSLVTPEADPLEVFGPAASRMLHDVLADRGIALRVNTLAERIHDGKLYLQPPGALEADQVVTLARLAGPAVRRRRVHLRGSAQPRRGSRRCVRRRRRNELLGQAGRHRSPAGRCGGRGHSRAAWRPRHAGSLHADAPGDAVDRHRSHLPCL